MSTSPAFHEFYLGLKTKDSIEYARKTDPRFVEWENEPVSIPRREWLTLRYRSNLHHVTGRYAERFRAIEAFDNGEEEALDPLDEELITFAEACPKSVLIRFLSQATTPSEPIDIEAEGQRRADQHFAASPLPALIVY